MTTEDRIAEILADWFDRRERGESVLPEDLLREHPDLAEELRARFEDMELLRDAFLGDPSLPEGVPAEIGDFRILGVVGRGGMGTVYEAVQKSLGRRVALKLLSPSILSTPEAVRRFRREARAAGRLHHTNIVPVYAMGEHRGHYYYVMELVRGRPLDQVVAEMRGSRQEGSGGSSSDPQLGSDTTGRSYYERIAEKFAGVADGLETAHTEGVIHRDVKPANLLLDAEGNLRLVDFGLARFDGLDATLTATGAILGTPRYMSPEQAAARRIRIDHRTDVYSLGATLYEILTLEPPFSGDDLQDLCVQISTKDPVAPRHRQRRIPRDLETIVTKAMEKERSRRYRTAGEFARDLRRFAEHMPIRARRTSLAGKAWRKMRRNPVRAVLVAAVVLLAAVGAFFAVGAGRAERRVAELEYSQLLSSAEKAVAGSWHLEIPSLEKAHLPNVSRGEDEVARSLYSRAIAVAPERHEAWLGRALVPGTSAENALADLEQALRRGLSRRTYHLARMHLFAGRGEWEKADAEAALAESWPRGAAFDDYFESRILLLVRRDYAGAERLLTAVIQAEGPGSGFRYLATRRRAQARAKLGDLDGALADLAALREMGDESPRVFVQTAWLWRRLEKEDLATEWIDRAIALARAAGNPEAWFALSAACRAQVAGDWLEQVAVAGLEEFPDSIALLREWTVALTEQERYQEALDNCERALAIDPEAHRVQEMYGITLRGMGRLEEARGALEKAVRLFPDCSISRQNLALVVMAEGEHEEALRLLRVLQERHPNDVPLIVNEGIVHRKTGKFDAAREAWARAKRADPSSVSPWINEGAMLADDLGDLEAALAAFDEALRRNPRSREALFNRALVLDRSGRREESALAYEEAVEIHPEVVHLHTNHWNLLQRLGRDEEARRAMEAALARESETFPARHVKAHALKALERYDEALAAFEALARESPDDAHVVFDLAYALQDAGRLEDAVAAYEEFAGQFPRNRGFVAKSWSNRGNALSSLGRKEEAAESAAKAVEVDPEYADGHFNLGAKLAVLEKLEAARRAYARAAELNPEDGLARLRMGRMSDRLGRPEEAIDCYEAALECDPDLLPGLMHLGMALMGGRDVARAFTLFDRATKLRPEEMIFHIRRGQTAAFQGDMEEALASYSRARDLAPENPDTHYLVALAYRDLEKFEESIASFRRAIERNERHLPSLQYLAQLLCVRNRFEEAEETLRKVLELQPEHQEAHVSLCFVLHRTGRFEKAVEIGRKAVEIAPKYPWSHYQLGFALLGAEEWEEALGAFEEACRLDPAWYGPHVGRGLAYDGMGRHEDELAAYDRAIEMAPGVADLHSDRGTALRALERIDDALEAWKTALRIHPGHSIAAKNMAEVCAHEGRYAEALRYWDVFRELEPDSPDGDSGYAEALWHLGRYGQAREVYRELSESRPEEVGPFGNIVRTWMDEGSYPEALEECDAFLEVHSGSWWLRRMRVTLLRATGRHEEAQRAAREYLVEPMPEHGELNYGYLLAAAGRKEESRRLLADLDAPHVDYFLAFVAAVRGETNEAIALFEKAVEKGLYLPPNAVVEPDLLPLLRIDRFAELVNAAHTVR